MAEEHLAMSAISPERSMGQTGEEILVEEREEEEEKEEKREEEE